MCSQRIRVFADLCEQCSALRLLIIVFTFTSELFIKWMCTRRLIFSLEAVFFCF